MLKLIFKPETETKTLKTASRDVWSPRLGSQKLHTWILQAGCPSSRQTNVVNALKGGQLLTGSKKNIFSTYLDCRAENCRAVTKQFMGSHNRTYSEPSIFYWRRRHAVVAVPLLMYLSKLRAAQTKWTDRWGWLDMTQVNIRQTHVFVYTWTPAALRCISHYRALMGIYLSTGGLSRGMDHWEPCRVCLPVDI